MSTDLRSVPVLVGGVSELYQRDLDLGRLAVERLQTEQLGPGVAVEDLHYGAVAVAQRLEELRPGTLILVSAVRRGRRPGAVHRRLVGRLELSVAQAQAAVGDAVTGYVHPDLVVEIASALGVLPARTVAVEVEPAATGSGEGLSAPAAVGLEAALELVRTEVRRAPLLELALELRCQPPTGHADAGVTSAACRNVLEELARVDQDGQWGRTFALRDRLREDIGGGRSGPGMDHRGWGLWWALVEELDRLQALEAALG